MNKKTQWEASYENKNNFMFYPHEELIRFFSKYIRKRTGLTQFADVLKKERPLKCLDFGCGIGRHIVYVHQMGVEAYGVDLSSKAVAYAQNWASQAGIKDASEKIVNTSGDTLPWNDVFFDTVICHAVLDSMSFELAKQCVQEIHRVLVDDGLFYCDLISGDDHQHGREFAGEVTVESEHEKGTIQSYFNYSKVQELVLNRFEIVDIVLVKREDLINPGVSARYHIVLKKI